MKLQITIILTLMANVWMIIIYTFTYFTWFEFCSFSILKKNSLTKVISKPYLTVCIDYFKFNEIL